MRAPAHGKVPGSVSQTTHPPKAEQQTVTAPTANREVPESSSASSSAATTASAPEAAQETAGTAAAASASPAASAGTSTVTEPTAVPVRSGGTSEALVADSPRTADTSRYTPSATSEWAAGDSGSAAGDATVGTAAGTELSTPGTGATPDTPAVTAEEPRLPEAGLQEPGVEDDLHADREADDQAQTPDASLMDVDASPAAADKAATGKAAPDEPGTIASEDSDSRPGRDAEIGGGVLAGGAALAAGAALARHESGDTETAEEKAKDESPETPSASVVTSATAREPAVSEPPVLETAEPAASGAKDDWFQALGSERAAGPQATAPETSGAEKTSGTQAPAAAEAPAASAASPAASPVTDADLDSRVASGPVTPPAARRPAEDADEARRATAAMPYGPGSAAPLEDGSAPSPGYTIKANPETMRYHTPESPDYDRTRHQVWFSTEEAAATAGFRPWNHEERERGRQSAADGAQAAGVAAAVPAPRTEVPEGPHGPGSAYPRDDGSAPAPHFVIKGNADSGLYHGEESQGYHGTRAEVWFETEEHAEAAGFKAWNWRARERKAKQTAPAGGAAPVTAQTPAPAPAAEAPAAPAASAAEAAPQGSPVATVTEEARPATDTTAAGPDDGTETDVASAVPAPRTDALPGGPDAPGVSGASGNDQTDNDQPTEPEATVTEETATTQTAAAPVATHHDGIPHGPHGEGSAHPLEDGSSPHERFHVKGNDDSGLYHTSDSPSYHRTGAEVWFASNEHAEAAGYKHWNHRKADREDLVPEGPHGAGSAHPRDDASAPHERFHVKGNADSGLYHTSDSPSYHRTGAEVWFASEEHARAAGYKHWDRKKREAEEVPAGPHGPGSAHPLEDGASPHERFAIKGNADSGLYHTPESPYHGRTRAEVWFETEDHARAAGYKPWNWRDAESQ